MAVARPILLVGPDPSHVTDLIRGHNIGWQISHGDIDGAVETIRRIAAMSPSDREMMGARAAEIIRETLSKSQLCGRFCDVIDQSIS